METSRSGPGRMSRRAVLIAAVCAAIAVLGLFYWYWSQGPDPAHAARTARAAVPVSVAIASRQDVPIYLTGLGTVQALFTVGIHAQVDGKLQEVFFKEGQHVKKGDVLAKIDPRLYQAALDQAKAKKAQDEATLIAAAEGPRALPDAGRSRTSRPSRTSISSRPRSIRSRPRSTPTTPRSKPRRPSSTTPTSRRRATAASACAWSIPATSCMPPTRADRDPDADPAGRRAVHAAGAGARRRARRDGARPGRGHRLRPGQRPPARAPARCC